MSEHQKEIPKGGVKEMLAMALPMVVSNACETVMTVTDRYYLSQLGPEHMAASMGGGLFAFTMMAVFVGLLGYSTAMVAQFLGAERRKHCFTVTFHAILLCGLAYPIILCLKPIGSMMFESSGIRPEQLQHQLLYYNILCYGAIIPLLRMALSHFLTGMGSTLLVMLGSLFTMVLNMGFNRVLIFGWGPVPALGMAGAAYGTLLAGFCGLLFMGLVCLRHRHFLEYPLLASCRFDGAIFKTLLRKGTPAGMEFLLNILAFSMIVTIFQSHSLPTATAVTIVFNWDMIAFVPLIGVEIAVSSLVGRYVGAKDHDTAHRSVISGLKVGMVICAGVAVFFALMPALLVEVFRPLGDQTLFETAKPMAENMLRVASLYVVVEALMVVYSGALRGAGDTTWAMIISVGCHWTLVVMLKIALDLCQWGPEKTWILLTLVFFALSTTFYFRYSTGKWREIKILPLQG